jgi:hypothetical protein
MAEEMNMSYIAAAAFTCAVGLVTTVIGGADSAPQHCRQFAEKAMPAIFLTHIPDMLKNYYSERALADLRKLGDVRLNDTGQVLDAKALAQAAQGCEIIISDRQTAAPAEFFPMVSDLVAFLRVAVDIRNVDVAAASGQGIPITHATPGFIASVAEMAIGFTWTHFCEPCATAGARKVRTHTGDETCANRAGMISRAHLILIPSTVKMLACRKRLRVLKRTPSTGRIGQVVSQPSFFVCDPPNTFPAYPALSPDASSMRSCVIPSSAARSFSATIRPS